MPAEPIARLPLLMVPQPLAGETVASYAARVDAATAAPAGHVWGLALADHREHSGLSPHQGVPDPVAEQAVLALLHELVGDRTLVLATEGRPSRIVWHACLLCTSGTPVAVHPDHARCVCSIHRLWTGPGKEPGQRLLRAVPQPLPAHSRPVAGTTLQAEAFIFESTSSRPLIDDVLRRAASALRQAWDGVPAPADLPVAAAILQTVTDPSIVAAVSNPLCDYATAYEAVAQRMAAAGNPSGDAGVDEAWLLLRWTAAAARHRWAGEWNSEDPAPLVQPLEPDAATDYSALQPFHAYLDCLRTRGREDEYWWDDRYTQAASPDRNLCPEGHVLNGRPSKDHRHAPYDASCAICSGHKVITGYNSLADLMPPLAEEWDPQALPGPTPWTVAAGSNRMGQWRCPNGHRYQATFANRALRGAGCPHCGYHKVLTGVTDLATTHPHLAALWHPEAGNTKTPIQLSAGNSSDRITWRCPLGHAFVRTPAKLVATGGRCQTCQGRILLRGTNDLATERPDVAAQWHPRRNETRTPADVQPGSEKAAWWQCPNGHEFQMRICDRCRYPKLTCPVETGRRLVRGVSDLATIEPLLVLDWDDQRNECRSDEVVPGNAKRWWTCRNGHTQHALVVNRRRAGGCTRCPPDQRVAPSSCKTDRWGQDPATEYRDGREH